MTEEAQIAEESGTLLDEATPTLSEGEYFLSDGIKGTGDTPEWYKHPGQSSRRAKPSSRLTARC